MVAASGALADRLLGVRFPAAGSMSQRALARARPVVTADVSGQASGPQPVAQLDTFGPAMFVPLIVDGRGLGTITLAKRKGARPFNAAHPGLVETFARQAALALERQRHRRDLTRLELLEDRERIARDLHDTVIQQLFAVGLDLESIAARLSSVDGRSAQRLEAAVAALDDTIREIRVTIFAVRRPAQPTLADRVAEVSTRAASGLGFQPRVEVRAVSDVVDVPADVVDDVIAVLREALANVVRHAGATSVAVVVDVSSELSVHVVDNGCGVTDVRGPRQDGTGSGLGNMRERAEARGGRCGLRPAPDGGTIVEWCVPLRH